ncbi:TPA: Lrp/AsnC family transcriptional regulator [Burkholderia cenocepacia]|nr:Lrp/AsnC family transcriptional regulator [Burkholderia cenocepacia]HDR9889983.1 Lrp/AsnC family transcriptional regulator [Burkholderia cenocepacia]
MKLDAIDKRILRALQQNSNQTNAELAQQVGLSPTPCLRRVHLLEEHGVINGYVALLNPAAIELKFSTFVRITLERQDKTTVERFAREIEKAPEVLECHLMAGSYDYLLRIVAKDLDDYQRFQMETLTKIDGVRNVQTEIPLRQIKHTTRLPIG